MGLVGVLGGVWFSRLVSLSDWAGVGRGVAAVATAISVHPSRMCSKTCLATLWAAAFGCAKVAHTFPFRPASVVTAIPLLNAFRTRCTRFGGTPDSARCRPAILSVLTSWLCPNEHSIVLSFTVARSALVKPVEDNKSNGGQNLLARSRTACQCFSRSCTVVGHPASFTLAAIEGLLLDAAFSAAPALSAAPTATAAPFAFRLSLVAVQECSSTAVLRPVEPGLALVLAVGAAAFARGVLGPDASSILLGDAGRSDQS